MYRFNIQYWLAWQLKVSEMKGSLCYLTVIIKRICVGMMFIVILLSKDKFHLDFWDAHELLLTTLFLVYFQPPSFYPCFFFFLVKKEQNLNQVLLQVWKDTRLSGIKWVPQFGECIGLVFPAARYFWGSVLERRTWVLGSDSLYPKPCKMEIRTLLPHRIMGRIHDL